MVSYWICWRLGQPVSALHSLSSSKGWPKLFDIMADKLPRDIARLLKTSKGLSSQLSHSATSYCSNQVTWLNPLSRSQEVTLSLEKRNCSHIAKRCDFREELRIGSFYTLFTRWGFLPLGSGLCHSFADIHRGNHSGRFKRRALEWESGNLNSCSDPAIIKLCDTVTLIFCL